MELIITSRGTTTFIYTEMLDLSVLGRPCIRRASHVEPDERGRWWADLGPVEGPRLGPYDRRSDALAAELAWLREHLGGLIPTSTSKGV
jgi:hypothetical protein